MKKFLMVLFAVIFYSSSTVAFSAENSDSDRKEVTVQVPEDEEDCGCEQASDDTEFGDEKAE